MGINKTLIIGLVAIVLVAVVYFAFLRGEDVPLLERTGESSLGASAQADRELLVLLQALESIKLDPKFFDDPVYQSLEDFRVEPAEEPVGRQNPFAPLGSN